MDLLCNPLACLVCASPAKYKNREHDRVAGSEHLQGANFLSIACET